MSTQAIFNVRQHPRRLALIAGVAILAIAAALIVMRALEIQRRAADRVVEIGATYRLMPDLKALTRQADLVVVGRVVGNGKVSFAQRRLMPVRMRSRTGTRSRSTIPTRGYPSPRIPSQSRRFCAARPGQAARSW